MPCIGQVMLRQDTLGIRDLEVTLSNPRVRQLLAMFSRLAQTTCCLDSVGKRGEPIERKLHWSRRTSWCCATQTTERRLGHPATSL